MKNLFATLAFITFFGFSSCLLVSCQKEDTPAVPEPKSQQPTEHHINFNYVDNFLANEFELIVTDSSGKYLLDTILPVKKMISATFLSNEKRFNITTIESNSSNGSTSYNIKTYYQVALKQWNINQQFVAVPQTLQDNLPQGPTITYINAPKIDYNSAKPLFVSGLSASYGSTSQVISMGYRKPDPYYSYLIIPSSRLYKFHQTSTNHDTVNLAEMDTALSINYKKDFELDYSFRELIGYKKKDDYSTYTRLWDGAFDPKGTIYGDFLYPTKGVEQYLVKVMAFDKQGVDHYSQELSEKMPDSLAFLDDSHVNVTKSASNSYKISFPKGVPTTYSFYIQGNKMMWEVMFPSDKTSFEGTDKFIDLKNSKSMNSFDFSTVKVTSIKLLTADTYNFYDYLDVLFNPNMSSSVQKIKKYMFFSTDKGL